MIQISQENGLRVYEIGNYGDSADDFIGRLLDYHEHRREIN